MTNLPLVVIVGPTASGKTSLAVKLAQAFDGEIISADSRAIYRGLNIGTAKPTVDEQAGVSHWGIDLVEPDQIFSVADFKKYTIGKISEIRRRGKIPFLVGGSGLYVDSVIFDYQFPDEVDYEAVRQKYNEYSVEDLIKHCKNNNIELPENKFNKRYLINQIARRGTKLRKRQQIIDDCVVFGLKIDRDSLRQKIAERVKLMFSAGVVVEAETIADRYSWGAEAMTGNIYKIAKRYQAKELSLGEAVDLAATADWRLAKRQMTWFRRNSEIIWLNPSDAESIITQKLSNMLK